MRWRKVKVNTFWALAWLEAWQSLMSAVSRGRRLEVIVQFTGRNENINKLSNQLFKA